MHAGKVLKEIEIRAESEFLPIVGKAKGSLLIRLLRKHKPKRILEIGTLVGYSAILMAANSTARITTIEQSAQHAKEAERNIGRAGLADRIEVLVGDATETMPNLKEKFDFIFIDAAKSAYLDYLLLCEVKMHPATVIVADNAKIFAAEMKDYLAHVRNSGMYRSEFHDFGFDGMEVSVRL
ncbi:MAG: class I SAM-dependent methyltransferase [Candidatus Aenigmarchaeota archaeon]|nr:class I SAM-dependent methyltransferase [Candidatus Aenigmarchaeota archaeon]